MFSGNVTIGQPPENPDTSQTVLPAFFHLTPGIHDPLNPFSSPRHPTGVRRRQNIVGPPRPDQRARRSHTGVALRCPQQAPRCAAGRGLAPPALDARAAGRHRTVFVSTCPHGRSARKPADSRHSEIRPSIGMENAESGSGFKVTRHDRFPGCEQHGDRPERADCRTDSVPDQEQRRRPRRGRGVHPGLHGHTATHDPARPAPGLQHHPLPRHPDGRHVSPASPGAVVVSFHPAAHDALPAVPEHRHDARHPVARQRGRRGRGHGHQGLRRVCRRRQLPGRPDRLPDPGGDQLCRSSPRVPAASPRSPRASPWMPCRASR